jgi:hypothetical protein
MKTRRHIQIEGGKVILDGDLRFTFPGEDLPGFLKSVYRAAGFDYPKFFKMSVLSKLGFLAAELLLENEELSDKARAHAMVLLANRSSSLHTDALYQGTIGDKPSPAIFVYTLPNIVIGEVCIRHGFKGEGIFFIEEDYSRERVLTLAREELEAGTASLALAGWLEVDMEGNYLADIDLLR